MTSKICQIFASHKILFYRHIVVCSDLAHSNDCNVTLLTFENSTKIIQAKIMLVPDELQHFSQFYSTRKHVFGKNDICARVI